MRPSHPIVKLIVQEFHNYEDFIDGDYNISSYKYITNLKDLYEVFNIIKVKNYSDNYLICTGSDNVIRFKNIICKTVFIFIAIIFSLS